MRILHLIDGGAPAADGRTDDAVLACRLAVGARGHEHRVILLGGPVEAARAAALGLAIDWTVRAPAGVTALARREVRRLLAAWRPDVVNAWDPAAEGLATAAEPVRGYVITSEDAAPWLRWRGPDPTRTVNVVPVAEAEAVPTDGRLCRVAVPPPVQATCRDPAVRAATRRELGLKESDVAVLLLGSAPYGDAMRFVFLLRLLREAGCRAAGLIPAAAAQVARAGRFARQPSPLRFIASTRIRPALLAATDVAVWEGGGPGPTASWEPRPGAASTPIAAAHAAGVPAIAPHWAMIPELYCPESARLCLAHNTTLPELARRLLPMIEDPDRRARASGMVASHLRDQDPGAGFLKGLGRAWAMAASGRPAAAGAQRVGVPS